jgi:hypothetical protein
MREMENRRMVARLFHNTDNGFSDIINRDNIDRAVGVGWNIDS